MRTICFLIFKFVTFSKNLGAGSEKLSFRAISRTRSTLKIAIDVQAYTHFRNKETYQVISDFLGQNTWNDFGDWRLRKLEELSELKKPAETSRDSRNLTKLKALRNLMRLHQFSFVASIVDGLESQLRHSCSRQRYDSDSVPGGLLDKLIWEDAERGISCSPVLIYSFGTSMPKLTGKL